MKYIGTEEEIEGYNNTVNNAQNYKGTTTQWDKVLKHPTLDLYCINAHQDFIFEGKEKQELTSDWFTEI